MFFDVKLQRHLYIKIRHKNGGKISGTYNTERAFKKSYTQWTYKKQGKYG